MGGGGGWGWKRGLLPQIEKLKRSGEEGEGEEEGASRRGRASGVKGKDAGCARESEMKQTTEREGRESCELAGEGMLSLSRPVVKDCYIIICLSRL